MRILGGTLQFPPYLLIFLRWITGIKNHGSDWNDNSGQWSTEGKPEDLLYRTVDDLLNEAVWKRYFIEQR
jgi:hypothetical protein